MKNEMDFLKDKINESGVKAPGDMDERYVLDTLRDVTPKPIEPEPKVKKKFNWKPLVAAAAVVLVAAVGTAIGVRIYQQNLIKDSTVTLNGGLSLRRFNSYEELQDEVNRIRNERKKTDAGEIISGISDFLSGSYGAKSDNYNGGYVSDGMAAESSRSGSASDSHSETYKQVDGVDEADIVKTDGNYIYYLSSAENQIIIAEAKKESEDIIRAAEERKKQMVDQSEIMREAKAEAAELLNDVKAKASEMRKAANDYVENVMKRTDDAITAQLTELRKTRQNLRITKKS